MYLCDEISIEYSQYKNWKRDKLSQNDFWLDTDSDYFRVLIILLIMNIKQ